MKGIFKYPNEAGTQYIDPNYVGDATKGFYKRVDDLRTGTYKAWDGTAPTATTNEIMENMSKFHNRFEETWGENTIYKFHEIPMVVGDVDFIGNNITSGTVADPAVFTTDSTWQFTSGEEVQLLDLDGGFSALNGQTFYIQTLTSTTANLSWDQAGTDLLTPGNPEDMLDYTVRYNSDGTLTLVYDRTPDFEDGSSFRFQESQAEQTTVYDYSTLDGQIMGEYVNHTKPVYLVGNVYLVRRNDGVSWQMFYHNDETDTWQFLYHLATLPFSDDDNIRISFSDDNNLPDSDRYHICISYVYGSTMHTYIWRHRQGHTATEAPTLQWSSTYTLSGSQPRHPAVLSGGFGSLYIMQAFPEYDSGKGCVYMREWNGGAWAYEVFYTRALASNGTLPDIVNGKFGSDFYPGYNAQTMMVARCKASDDDKVNIIEEFSWVGSGVESAGVWSSRNFDNVTWDFSTQDANFSLDALHFKSTHECILRDIPTTIVDAGNYFFTGIDFSTGTGDDITTYDRILYIYKEDRTHLQTITETVASLGGVYDVSTKFVGGRNPKYLTRDSSNFQVQENWVYVGTPKYRADSGAPVNQGKLDLYKFNYNTGTYDLFESTTGTLANDNYGKGTLIEDGVVNMFGVDDSAKNIKFRTTAYPAFAAIIEHNENLFLKNDATDNEYTLYTDSSLTTVARWSDGATTSYAEYLLPATDNYYTIITSGQADVTIFDTTAVVGDATQGKFVVPDSDEYRYYISGASVIIYGNKQFQYLDINGDTQPGGFVNDHVYDTNGILHAFQGGTSGVTPTFDANGRLSGVSFTPNNARLDTAGPVIFQISPNADLYVAPAPDLAAEADDWDLATEWDDLAYDPYKEWPSAEHGFVNPRSAKIILTNPSNATRSQNGIKYVRSLGFQKYQLEVEYPPLTADQFRYLHAAVQDARGMAVPFMFTNKNNKGEPLLMNFHDPDLSDRVRFKQEVVAGDKYLLLEGYPSSYTNAARKGELIAGDYLAGNGYVSTNLIDVDSNAYGEVKIKLPYPTTGGGAAYKGGLDDLVEWSPYHFTVTLADQEFEYEIDTLGYYYVKVTFDFDEWKA